MSDFLKVLFNIRSLRATARDIPLEQLKEGFEKFKLVLEEKERAEESDRKLIEEKERKINEFKQLLAADGIELGDLLASTDNHSVSTRAPRKPLEPKYQYIDQDGNTRTWTGQGRQPVPIRQAIEAGSTLDYFLIQN